MFTVGQGAIVSLHPGEQFFQQRLSKHVFAGLLPYTIARQHDQERWELPTGDQRVTNFRDSQAKPLIIGITLPVKQIQNRIAAVRLLIITRRQVNVEI